MSAEHAWKALAEVNGWIRVADVKATALLSLSGLLGGWMLMMFPQGKGPTAATVVITVGLALTFTTSCLALRALRPAPGCPLSHSLLYFDDVARGYLDDRTAYVRDCAELLSDEERLVNEVCDQIWINSTVAARKFRDINRALFALVPGLGLAVSVFVSRFW